MTFPVATSTTGARGVSGREITVGLVQAACRDSAEGLDVRDHNLSHALPAIEQAARDGAELVVLGELFLQGPGNSRWASFYSTRLDGTDPHVQELEAVAARLDVTLLVGCTSFAADGFDVRNSALVVTPDGLQGAFDKAHLASFPYARGISAEQTFYSPGSSLAPIETPAGRLGVHICYDIFFPEVGRTQALLGADLFVNLAAAGEGFESYWDHLTWARATENGSWYLMCSVVGETTERGYFGGSRIVAPDGEVIARAADHEEDVVMGTIDLGWSQSMRSQVHMFSVRQPSLYGPIVSDGVGTAER